MPIQNVQMRLCGDRMLYKIMLRKIKKSLGRYLSIFIIVMIGVGFHSGIQSSAPDILKVADVYYRNYNLMDFKIISSMGLTDSDVAALKKISGIKEVVPSYSLDVLEKDKAIRIHAIENNMNKPKIIAGRPPESESECVADSKSYQIGDKIYITSDISEKLKENELTVVGLVESVLYASEDYGISTISDGKLSSFVFMEKNDFILDAYTEIYIAIEQTENTDIFSNKYKDIISELSGELYKIKPYRESARFSEIYKQANDEIDENELKLNEEMEKSNKQLSDARNTLDNNAKKLKDAKSELLNNEANLQKTIDDKNAEFESAQKSIADGREKIHTALQAFKISEEKLDIKIIELTLALQEINSQLAQLPADNPQYIQMHNTATEYSAMLSGLGDLKASVDELNEQEKQLQDGIFLFNSEIEKARMDIAKGKTEIEENGKNLNAGYAEYEDNLNRFNNETSDAQSKIQDAKTKLAEIEHPKWYISNRNDIAGYSELEGAIKIITAFAAIIPFFFIIIVILMTSNSMTRMITEERGELGTLTSLGYSDGGIISTYLIYVLSATGLGAGAGFFLGCTVIPPLIYSNFPFIMPPLILQYDLFAFMIILAVTLTVMSFVTVAECRKQLKEKPAYLMRPAPPKQGKRILLEKLGLVWNRFSFIWKITVRNMFRYKKRGIMTIAGVAGCTALLLIGFGLQDSMDGVAEKQYSGIFRYNNMIVLKDETPSIGGELKTLLERENISDSLLISQNAYQCAMGGQSLDVFVVAPQDNTLFNEYYHLKSTVNKKNVFLGEGGAIITQRIAKKFNVGKGDVITIRDAHQNIHELSVSDVVENYLSNYIYIESHEYNKIFGESTTYNAVVSKYSGDEQDLAKRLIDSGLVANIHFTSDAIEKIIDSNNSLHSIIVLLIVVASLLAIIVLYNLTAINISERTREIATLKVLGFYDGETNAYIYREALILTFISIGIGLILGIFLHSFVLNVIETDTRVLLRTIKWFSFVASGLLTLAFSLIMQIITYFKLKSIDMIESLKSVE